MQRFAPSLVKRKLEVSSARRNRRRATIRVNGRWIGSVSSRNRTIYISISLLVSLPRSTRTYVDVCKHIIQAYFLDAKKWPATFDRFYRKATLEREVPHGLRSKTDAFRLFINVLLLGRLSKFRSHPDIFSHAPGESILSRRSFVTPRSTVTILRNQCALSLSLSLSLCVYLCSILIQFPLASARRKINYQSFDEKRSTVWKRFVVAMVTSNRFRRRRLKLSD